MTTSEMRKACYHENNFHMWHPAPLFLWYTSLGSIYSSLRVLSASSAWEQDLMVLASSSSLLLLTLLLGGCLSRSRLTNCDGLNYTAFYRYIENISHYSLIFYASGYCGKTMSYDSISWQERWNVTIHFRKSQILTMNMLFLYFRNQLYNLC